jgi:hypothetical protein
MLESYGANQAPLRRARPRLIYQLLRSDRSTDAEARRDFQDALQRELARGVLSREETMLALDALVTSGLIYRDPPPLHAHLDAWSRQALQLGPDIATLRSSRGAVLVELGRCQEGKALLIPLVGARLDKPIWRLHEFGVPGTRRARAGKRRRRASTRCCGTRKC